MRWLVPGLLALAIVGCGGSSDKSDEAETSPASDPRSVPSDSAALPTPVPAANAARASLDQRAPMVKEISVGPDRMVAAFGTIWVKLDDGHVVRVDPETGKTVATYFTGYDGVPACSGIGADDRQVWACAGENRLVTIDPEADKASKPFKLSRLNDQARFVFADGQMWFVSAEATSLVGVDPDDHSAQTTIDLGTFCSDVATDGSRLWVVCPSEGKVLAVDPTAGAVTAEVELPGARDGSAGDSLFVMFDAGVAQLDLDSLEVEAVYDVAASNGGLRATESSVWVRSAGADWLTRIDPMAGEVAEVIEAPDYPSGGDVLVIGDDVWATAFNDDVLVTFSAVS